MSKLNNKVESDRFLDILEVFKDGRSLYEWSVACGIPEKYLSRLIKGATKLPMTVKDINALCDEAGEPDYLAEMYELNGYVLTEKVDCICSCSIDLGCRFCLGTGKMYRNEFIHGRLAM